MIVKRLMALDGVMAVCHFRDDGALIEGIGMGDQTLWASLAKFAHDYKRIVQGNADQLAMFTKVSTWTPPGGWIVRGQEWNICSMGNLVCVIEQNEASTNEIMQGLKEAASW